MVVFSPFSDFILITQFKDDFKKKHKKLSSFDHVVSIPGFQLQLLS